jgi:hypothetical protein
MRIKHIGQSIILTLHCDLALNLVLHIPQASKNLAFVHHFTSDNNVLFELHLDTFFIIKVGLKGYLSSSMQHIHYNLY